MQKHIAITERKNLKNILFECDFTESSSSSVLSGDRVRDRTSDCVYLCPFILNRTDSVIHI